MENNAMSNNMLGSHPAPVPKKKLSKEAILFMFAPALLLIVILLILFEEGFSIATMHWSNLVLHVGFIIASIAVIMIAVLKKRSVYFGLALPSLYLAFSRISDSLEKMSRLSATSDISDTLIDGLLEFALCMIPAILIIVGYAKNLRIIKIIALWLHGLAGAGVLIFIRYMLSKMLRDEEAQWEAISTEVMLGALFFLIALILLSIALAIALSTDFNKKKKAKKPVDYAPPRRPDKRQPKRSAPQRARANAPQQARANAPQQARANAPQQARANAPLQARANAPLQARANAPQQAGAVQAQAKNEVGVAEEWRNPAKLFTPIYVFCIISRGLYLIRSCVDIFTMLAEDMRKYITVSYVIYIVISVLVDLCGILLLAKALRTSKTKAINHGRYVTLYFFLTMASGLMTTVILFIENATDGVSSVETVNLLIYFAFSLLLTVLPLVLMFLFFKKPGKNRKLLCLFFIIVKLLYEIGINIINFNPRFQLYQKYPINIFFDIVFIMSNILFILIWVFVYDAINNYPYQTCEDSVEGKVEGGIENNAQQIAQFQPDTGIGIQEGLDIQKEESFKARCQSNEQ